ncbi:unnamed protein product [Boreogadus saida]
MVVFFSGGDLKPAFRLPRESYYRLLALLPRQKAHGWSHEVEVLVALYWLACGASYRVTADAFGMPLSTVCRKGPWRGEGDDGHPPDGLCLPPRWLKNRDMPAARLKDRAQADRTTRAHNKRVIGGHLAGGRGTILRGGPGQHGTEEQGGGSARVREQLEAHGGPRDCEYFVWFKLSAIKAFNGFTHTAKRDLYMEPGSFKERVATYGGECRHAEDPTTTLR